MYKQIGFIGLGLIGGSIAKAIKKNIDNIDIIAIDNDLSSIQAAYKDGIIINDNACNIDKLKECDIIFLCAPIKTNIEYLYQIKDMQCIITDVGSVKGEIIKTINTLNLNNRFIGGHPMCGSEKTGYNNSNDTLLENAYYILTNNQIISQDIFNEFKDFIKDIGSLPLEMTPDQHDFVTGGISHIPHIIASSLVNFVMNNDNDNYNMKTVAAGGFKDITRISSSSPVMWQNICLTNRDKILDLLDKYIDEVNSFKKAIDKRDAETIYHLFEEAKEYRDSINTGKGMIENVYEFYIDLEDKTGGIADVAKAIADANLNIKNIGIINNREYRQGVLRLEMYDEFSLFKAINTLKAKGYNIYA